MNNSVTAFEVPTDVAVVNRSVSSSLLSSSNSSSAGATDVLQLLACALLSSVAVIANVAVIVAVVRSRTQRRQLTNFFVVNLCLVDIVAAAVVMPLSTASAFVNSSLASASTSATATATIPTSAGGNFSGGCAAEVAAPTTPPFGWYPLLRVATTFVAFASVLSAAAVSVERCFSIRYPMLHAAHLTVGRTMGIIGYIWAQAGLLAAVPQATGWSVLAYSGLVAATGNWIPLPVHACWSGWPIVFVVAATFLFFVVPSTVMAIAYCAVYRVARRTARQICPSTCAKTMSTAGLDCSRGVTESGDRTPSDGRLQLDCSDVPTAIIPLSSCTFSSTPSPLPTAAVPVPSATSTTGFSDSRPDNGAMGDIAIRETSAGDFNGCDGTMALSLNGACCRDQQHQQPASETLRSSFHCCSGGNATVSTSCCGCPGSDQSNGTPRMPDVCVVTIHTECCNESGRNTVAAIPAAAAAAAAVSNSLSSLPEVVQAVAGGSQSNLLNVPQPSTNNNNNNSSSSNSATSPHHSPSPTTTIGSKINAAGGGGGGGGDMTGRKAAITLMFVVLTFVPLWTPFFVVGVYRTIDDWNRCRQIWSTCNVGGAAASAAAAAGVTATGLDRLESVVVWCALATFAINPFVYGWMNRAIRDELRSTFDAIRWSMIVCWRRQLSGGNGRSHWPRSSLVGGPGYADGLYPDGMWGGDDACGGLSNDPEDFFQFLERTSASRSQSAVPPPVSGSQRAAGSTTTQTGQSKSTTKSLAQGASRPLDGSSGGRLRCFVIDAHESSSSCSIANSEPNSSLWG